MNILDALDHPQLFKKWFDAPTWEAWRALLAVLFALPMSEPQLGIYRDCTKRTAAPSKAFNEAWLVCGRRAGKSSILALTAVFLACFKDYKPYLAPGEVAITRHGGRQGTGQNNFSVCRLPCCAKRRCFNGWLDGRDVLIVKADRQEPLVVVRMSLASELARVG